ncbi:MFS transporter [Rhodoluna lacicola]|jgi:CP family cyanate transporter-like MFS transporter|uniref:Cyanate permease n=1 Tax=Rhodoluna lacicola TaxID=529884 RepID=A0A060JFS3_9MICO|nr:MFS transporter [Rhodoluna lacicola]AIC47422.1 Cyanate permease [Rhodoluna lacicola]
MTKSKFGITGFLAIVFIAIVLRPPVASMGPLLQEIQLSLAVNAELIGLLAASPVLCFGLGAFASPWLVSKVGVNRAMLLVLVILALGSALRMILGYPGLLLGTIAAGLSIAIANVLLPTIVRIQFPNRVALVTGAYTTLLAISASLAAAAAVPSSLWLGGWNPALAIWIVPTVLAVLLWLPQIKGQEAHVAQPAHAAAEEKAAVLRSPISWAIVGFFGIQSLGFYALLGWMPSALISIGVSPQAAGNYLGFASAIGIPSGLIISSMLGRFKSLAWWAAGTSALTLLGSIIFTLVLRSTDTSLLLFACILIGLGMSATFPISLSLISTRASTQAQTTQLSAMAQGWGYLLAAAGTFMVGAVANLVANYALSFALITALTLIQAGIGFYAGRPGVIPAK